MYQYHVEIQKVIDGDTYDIDVDLGMATWIRGEHIRLYGVDTPEVYGVKKDSEEYQKGMAASNFAKSFIKKGTLGIVETIKDEKGKYGRYLAVLYVQVPEEVVAGLDNIRMVGNFYCINDILIAKGLARPYFL